LRITHDIALKCDDPHPIALPARGPERRMQAPRRAKLEWSRRFLTQTWARRSHFDAAIRWTPSGIRFPKCEDAWIVSVAFGKLRASYQDKRTVAVAGAVAGAVAAAGAVAGAVARAVARA